MSKRMVKLKVVAISENNPYPRDVRVRPHMEALAEKGYEVTVICPRDRNQPRREVVKGVRVYRFPTFSPGKRAISYLLEYSWTTLVISLFTLWVWVRHGMDVLHIYNPPESLFVAGLLPKAAGKKIVFDLRDISPELYLTKFQRSQGLLYRTLLWLERVMCGLSDYVIVVNESYRKIVVQRDHVPPERVTVVRQGPDTTKISPTGPDAALRARAPILIAFLGGMAGQDGIDYLLRALQQLDQRFGHKDWLCALVGPAEDLQALEALASRYGLSQRVWFPGFLSNDEWLPILSTADICVEPCPASPMNNISTMNKIMDYMALSKPTVAFDLPEHRFTAGEAALYAVPNDETDFACQITRLIEDAPLRSRLGQAGRRRMEQFFDWRYQKLNFLAMYKDLASRLGKN